MSRPTLALALIAKNEEENIERLFKSVEGCFDEIHLTDTGSTDRTVELAEKLGAKVHHFKWVDDFAAARNASFEPIKTDYIMWLDLDDVLENREAFINFRDHVMKLNDYWLATYHYSSDPQGKPVCSFTRERVFKRDRGFKWKYFIHEGVIPESPAGDIRAQFTPAWTVRHMRTESDLQKDRSRNLNIFLKNRDKLDPRMRYYYGKELFEADLVAQATEELSKALSDPRLEIHDRILAMQYLIFAYMRTEQFVRALDLATQGTILAPQRAEFYSMIGDARLKLGQIADAIPAFHAAKSCTLAPSTAAAPIFRNEDAYTVYPRVQLARIYYHMGQVELGEKEAKENIDLYQHPESEVILNEFKKLRVMDRDLKSAVPCEDIVISCPPVGPYEWDADIAKTRAMGGSETAAIEMASWLHKISGRPVKVFNVRDADKVCDGVEYISNKKVLEYMAKNKPYLHIAWRHNIKVTDAPTYLWCHDLTTPGAENHALYDKILCLTPFHKQYVMAMQGIPEEKIHVTRNGIKPERFQDGPWEKDPFRFVFGSSPDRGLDRAMRVLDRVREKYPLITLHVHYGIEHLHKYGLGDLADKLKLMMEERKDWVIYHGATQQDELMKSYKASSYLVQPSDWIETSCISAMELLACGVYPIFRKVGGVADTLLDAASLGMATLVDSDCITEREHDLYAEAVIRAVDSSAHLRVGIDPAAISWERVAQEWLRDLPKFTEGDELAAG